MQPLVYFLGAYSSHCSSCWGLKDDALAPLEHLRLKSDDLIITDDSSDMVSGGFSDVFCARLRASNGEEDGTLVAVKQLRTTGASLQRMRTAVVRFSLSVTSVH